MSAAIGNNYADMSDDGPISTKLRKTIKSVIIPASTIEIAANAFKNSAIEEVIFEENSNLQKICKGAFSHCKFLKSIKIPASVIVLGKCAFQFSKIEEIIFAEGSNLKNICKEAFSYSKVKRIKIPASVVELGEGAFSRSAIEEVIFENNSSLETIGIFTFGFCESLESISIPSSVTEISGSLFKSSGLKSITFADNSNLKKIGEEAFSECKLESISIPASVTEIGKEAFQESKLKEIAFAEGTICETFGQFAFSRCKQLVSIKIPASVVNLGSHTFYNSGLKVVTFAEDSKLKNIGKSVFNHSELQSIHIPSSVVNIDKSAFSYTPLQDVNFEDDSKLELIGEEAFHRCKELKSMYIPASVVTISEQSFSSTSLERVTFGDQSSLKIIGYRAFYDCKFLTNITLPSGSVEIRGDSFFAESGVEEIFYTDNSPTQTRSTNEYFIQLCREGEVSRCEEYLNTHNVNLSYEARESCPNSTKTTKNKLITALTVALSTKNADLCILLVKRRAHQNSEPFKYSSQLYPLLEIAPNDMVEILFDTSTQLLEILHIILRKGQYGLASKLLLKLKSNLFLGIWKDDFKKDDIPEDKVETEDYEPDGELLLPYILRANSMELFQLYNDCGFHVNYTNIPVFLKAKNLDNTIYQSILHKFLLTMDPLPREGLDNCFYAALKYGNVEIITKYLEIVTTVGTVVDSVNANTVEENNNMVDATISTLPKPFSVDLSEDALDSIFQIPHPKLDIIIPLLVPYMTNFGEIKEGYYGAEGCYRHHPETILSYLAFTKSFKAFKFIVESSTTRSSALFQPSHLVACSLFRGYFISRYFEFTRGPYDEIFDYLMRDDIRPLVLGPDNEWVDKSIFSCIRYGTERMAMKLVSLGVSLTNIFIHKKCTLNHLVSFSRYTLLSYACEYQGISLVKELIQKGIPVDGTMIDILGEEILPGIITKDNISSYGESNDDYDDSYADDNNSDSDSDNDNDNDDDGDDGDDDNDDDDSDDGDYSKNNNSSDVEKSLQFYYGSSDIPSHPWYIPYFCRKRLNINKDLDYRKRELINIDGVALILLNKTPLAVAMSNRKPELVQLLLNNGANPNAPALINVPTIYGLSSVLYNDFSGGCDSCEDTDQEIEERYGMDHSLGEKNSITEAKTDREREREIKREAETKIDADLCESLGIPCKIGETESTDFNKIWKTPIYQNLPCHIHPSQLQPLQPQKHQHQHVAVTRKPEIDVSSKKLKVKEIDEDIELTISVHDQKEQKELNEQYEKSNNTTKDSQSDDTKNTDFPPPSLIFSPMSKILALLVDHGLDVKHLVDEEDIEFNSCNYDGIINFDSIVSGSHFDHAILASIRDRCPVKRINAYIRSFLSDSSYMKGKDSVGNLVRLHRGGFLDMIINQIASEAKGDEEKESKEGEKREGSDHNDDGHDDNDDEEREESKSKKFDNSALLKCMITNPSFFLLSIHYGLISKRDTISDEFIDTAIELAVENLPLFLQYKKLLPHIFSLTMKNSIGENLLFPRKSSLHRYNTSHVDDPYSRYRLLHLGLNVNHRTNAGDTLLLHSIEKGSGTNFGILLSLGADITFLSKDGEPYLNLFQGMHCYTKEAFERNLNRHLQLLPILSKMNIYQDSRCICSMNNCLLREKQKEVGNISIDEKESPPLTKDERNLLQQSFVPGYTAETLSYFLSKPIVNTDGVACVYCNLKFENNDHCRPMVRNLQDEHLKNKTSNLFAHDLCFHKMGIDVEKKTKWTFSYLVNPTKPYLHTFGAAAIDPEP